MSKLLILRGLPGTGKSTWVKEECPADYQVINWDAMQASAPASSFREVRDCSLLYATSLLNAGKSVVVDNTNLTPKTIQSWIDIGKVAGATVEIKDFGIGVDECVRRDSGREKGRTGRAVIEKMALFAGLVEFDPSKKIVIFDMDGTLADCSWRRHHLEKKPKDHASFYANCDQDPPIPSVARWAQEVQHDYQLVVVSGRPTDLCGVQTERWLELHRLHPVRLFMRNRKDYRPDTIIKKEILDKIGPEKILFCVDDRPCVVNMWRENKVRVYPVGTWEKEF